MGLIIMYVYPLLPDIDHPISKITWNFIGIEIAGILFSIANNQFHFIDNGTTVMIASVILWVLTFICAQFAGHRGKIHTVVAGVIFAGAFYFVGHNVGLCIIALVAYYSHLVADGMWDSLYWGYLYK